MSITPLRFTGVSTYSQDFQQILTRAVNIAALPVKQMQNEQGTLLAKKQALSAANSSVAALGDAIANLGRIGDNSALSVSSSNTNRVTVANNGSSAAASYTITDITSVAKAASETTAAGLATANATAVDGDGQMELVIGGATHAIDIAANNNLDALAAAINNLGAGVTATVLNTGAGVNPYYLSLTSAATGATTLALRTAAGNGGSNILTATNQGANAEFKLNGLAVSKPDNVIRDVVPNLTFTILDKTGAGESVTLAATSNRGSLSTALSSFVSAYNALAEARNAHVGERAGILSGDTVIQQISRKLREVNAFSTADGTLVKSLTDVGIEIDKTGKMTFNTLKFQSLPSPNITEAYRFFNNSAGHFGKLTESLAALSDPLTGMIRAGQNQIDLADKRISDQIATITERIQNMQNGLQLKLQQADALLSGLQSQQQLIKSSYDSVNLTLFGKRD